MAGRRKRRLAPGLSAIGAWMPQTYLIAADWGPFEVVGRVYAGLGMKQLWPASPKGRRPAAWSLDHLGTGHRIFVIKAHETEAFTIAGAVAEMTDWDFNGLYGWKNRDPDLMDRVYAFIDSHPEITRRSGPGDEGVASEIALARA